MKKKRVSKWTDWIISRVQRGWTIHIYGDVETHTQATWRRDAVGESAHRWLLVALVLALVSWHRKVNDMRSEPGPFNWE